MSAREDLIGIVTSWYMSGDFPNPHKIALAAATEDVDAYAHELAEQIRNDDFPGYREERFYTGVEAAADLIDPEVEN